MSDPGPVLGTATVVTGEAVTLELPVARLGSRSLAAAIDVAVQLVFLYALLLVLALAARGLDGAAIQAVVVLVLVLVLVGYPVGMETFANGRTLGKMALGLRAVRDDGGPITARHALVRGVVGAVLEKPGLIPLMFLGVLTSGMRQDAKRMGDVMAGTVVISERVPGRIPPPPPMPVHLVDWAQALDLSSVDDGDALRARLMVGRFPQLTPATREQVLAEVVSAVLAQVTPPPPPWANPFDAVCAVLAERRRRDLERLMEQNRRTVARAGAGPAYDRVA